MAFDVRANESMLERSSLSSSSSIGLKCAWNGMSKEERRRNEFDQSRFDDESILLSGPYGDDVAFVKQFNDQILLGLFSVPIRSSFICLFVQVCPMVSVATVITVSIPIISLTR